MLRSLLPCSLALMMLFAAVVRSADDPNTFTDAEKAGPDFATQGEYSGEIKTDDGKTKVGVQVIAMGGGKFRAVGYMGGLPGDGWDRSPKVTVDGQAENGVTKFTVNDGGGVLKDGVIAVQDSGGNKLGELKRVIRQSPTLGMKPPEGAVVLFDGTNADQFENGQITEDKLLMQGVTSKRKFQSCQVHIEFRIPFQPLASGQGRGNSGCYLQGRYEVQMLDSFGLEGKHNECGGIYTIKDPDVNMCLPPLSWQTYDIDYTAATYDGAGKKTKDATATVKHNGVVIHQDVKLDHATTAAPLQEGPEPGPLYLQDHGNPVRYRNIWVVEKK